MTNFHNNTVEKYSSSGVDLGAFASTGLDGPVGIAIQFSVASVPEPSSLVLISVSLGVTGAFVACNRRRP